MAHFNFSDGSNPYVTLNNRATKTQSGDSGGADGESKRQILLMVSISIM